MSYSRNKLRKFDNQCLIKSLKKKPTINYPLCSKNSIIHHLSQRQKGTCIFPEVGNTNSGYEHLPLKFSVHDLLENKWNVTSLGLGTNGTNVVSGALDGRIMVCDLQPHSKSNSIFKSCHTDPIVTIKFLPASGDLQTISSDESGLIVHSLLDPSGQRLPGAHVLNSHYGGSSTVATLVNNPFSFLSAGCDSLVNEFDIRQHYKATSSFSTLNSYGRKVPIESIASHPSCFQEFCTGGMDGAVRFYDRRFIDWDTTPIKTCLYGEVVKKTSNLSYNSSGTEIVATSCYREEVIFLLIFGTQSDIVHPSHAYQGPLTKPNTDDLISRPNNFESFRTPFNPLVGAKFYGKEENFIVSGSARGELIFWDKNTREVVRIFPGHRNKIVALETGDTIPIVVTAGFNRALKIWAVEI